MLLNTVAFLLGIILYLQLPVQLSAAALGVLLLCAVCALKLKSLRLLLPFLMGVMWVGLFIAHLQSHEIPNHLQHKVLLISGRIISLVKHQGSMQSVVVEATQPIQGKLKLSDYHQALRLQAGQTWQLSVILKKPWGFANPGGFLYQDYLAMQGMVATGHVIASPNNRLLKRASPSILTLRARLAAEIAQYGDVNARFIQALSVGDRDDFSEDDWTVLQRTGTNHLVAISGLHIGLVAGLVLMCSQFLWRRSRVLCLLLPAQIAGACAAMLVAMMYAALAGFSLPTQRAVIMLAVLMLAVIARRSLLPWHSFGVALLLVLLLNPVSVLDSGFWLSFFAVAALIVSGRAEHKSVWLRWALPQCIVILGVAPWTLFYFHQFSWVSPLANFITIPIVGFVIVPLCLLTCLCFCLHASILAIICLHWAEYAMALVWWVLTGLSHCSFASMTVGYFPVWKLTVSVLMILMVLSALPWRYKFLSLLLLPILCVQPLSVPEGDFNFTLLDVGQGLASVIQTSHHILVFDTGPKFSDEFNAGAAVVIPFLQSLGVDTVDKLVLSHGDSDHIGGAKAIIQAMKVLSISTSVPQRFPGASECLAGQHWRWDGVDFEFLYPDAQHLGLDNNSSCVLKVSNGVYSVLSTGDIEALAERELVVGQSGQLQSSVLIAPHHGSKTSSSEDFLAAVRPGFVFFPVGYLNRFHFPSSVVVSRYQHLGIKLFSTAECGAILLSVNKEDPLLPLCYRLGLPFYLR